MASRYGAVFDAVLDRYADAAILIGMTVWAARYEQNEWAWPVGALALLGAVMISYSRARSDASAGVQYREGLASLASRDVRLFVVMLGSLIGWVFWTLVVLAMVTHLVVAYRMAVLRRAVGADLEGL